MRLNLADRAIAALMMLVWWGWTTPYLESAEPQRLLEINKQLDLTKITVTDAQVTLSTTAEAKALRVATGHKQDWPGITIKAPSGKWDLATYRSVTTTVRNVGKEPVVVSCRVDNPGADGKTHCVSGAAKELAPGQVATLRVDLTRGGSGTLGGKLFGMRGYPAGTGDERAFDPRNVNQLLFFVAKPRGDHLFEISDIQAEGVYTAPTASVTDAEKYFPLINTFGQYRHKSWPGKVTSLADLQQRKEVEAKDLTAHASPDSWDQYGGWKSGPQLKATGFFRVEKHQGKWWLVDPEGHLFWSHGIDCVRMLDSTPIEERDSWFEDFPGKQPELTDFFVRRVPVLKGHYAGRSVTCYSFSGANLRRKYGQEWKSAFADLAHRRLRSWGMNTIGNWSDEGIRLLHKTPYVDSLGTHSARRIEGSEGYWGKFPDVFDPSFRECLQRSMRSKVKKSAGDPWCIGFFSDNEIAWGDSTSLSIAALKSPPDQSAKKVFIADMRTKYGEIAKLNEAWGTKYASWEEMLQARTAPDKKKTGKDLEAFYTKAANAYFITAKEVLREQGTQQLYLGCRFAWTNPLAVASAAKHCDVVSFNFYRRSIADYKMPGGEDVPLMIGEFHFGALDRGMFHTGLVPVANQEERARAYRDYVKGALQHPQFVGTHWFQYTDQPTTGRSLDEENYQIGFLDIADTPYPETIAASRAVGYDMYSLRVGK